MRWGDVKAFGVGAALALVAMWIAGRSTGAPSQPYEHAASSRWGEITQHGKAKTPVVEAEFHGEMAMSDSLKETVEKSLVELERTSCGLVKLTIVWDFDSANGMMLAMFRGQNILAIANSSMVKAAFDGDDTELLGLTYAGAKWVFLVTDRINDNETADWVSAHEFSHAIGLEHVELGLLQPNAPLYPGGVAVWEADDLREFCRVWSCDVAMFESCRER